MPQVTVARTRSIAQAILLLANLLKRSANLAYNAELGLSSIAWTVVARLGAEGPMTQTELARRYLIDKGQLSRTAVELQELGLILRESRTWRSIELRLSPQGRKVLKSIERIGRDRQRALTAGLGEREITRLLQGLETISNNANALLAEREGASSVDFATNNAQSGARRPPANSKRKIRPRSHV